MPSILGGSGPGILSSLGPAGLAAVSNAFNSFLQNQQSGLNRQFQERENRKNREHQKRQQETAERKARQGQLLNLGIGVGAGALGGAVLGGLGAAGGAGGAAGGEAAAAATAATTGIGDVAGATLGAGALPFEALAGVSGGIGAGGGAIAGGAIGGAAGGLAPAGGGASPSLPNYTFGNSRGGSIGTGAALGALNSLSPGLLQAGTQIPFQRAEFGLRQQQVANQTANTAFNQSLGVANLGLATARENRLMTADATDAQIAEENLKIRQVAEARKSMDSASLRDSREKSLGFRQKGLEISEANLGLRQDSVDTRIGDSLFLPEDITQGAQERLRQRFGTAPSMSLDGAAGTQDNARQIAASIAAAMREGDNQGAALLFNENEHLLAPEVRERLRKELSGG